MENKFLKCRKLKSLMDARKCKDDVVWGVGVADEKFPTDFYDASDNHLKSYKKTSVQEKNDGNMNEKTSDPISFYLHKSIL